MSVSLMPFNLDLLILSASEIKQLSQIKVLDIFDGGSRNFHRDGLFSTEIFGKIGEERRNRSYAYIQLHIPILHPVIYKVISELKSLYQDILSGRTYAIWDPAAKDYIPSDALNGQTGYTFFLSHLLELAPEVRPGAKRSFNIALLDRYRDSGTYQHLIVMPAGMRDYVIDDQGKPSEDEINGMYRKIISISSMIESVNAAHNPEYLDQARHQLQLAVNEVYDYIKNLLEGKKSFVLGKWAGRKIFNSTRNVITSYIQSPSGLHDPALVSTNDTVVGLYQYMRAISPLAIKLVRDGWMSTVFTGPNNPAMLVNPDTMRRELVSIEPDVYDSYMTNEGLERLMAKYSQEAIRHQVLKIGKHYMGLIYLGPDHTYRIFNDITELPEDRSAKDVYPLTLTEMLYLSMYHTSHDTPCLVTRYPITGYGSIYPSYTYLKTTAKSEIRTALDDQWVKTDHVAKEFPIRGNQFYNSMGVSSSHLGRLSADERFIIA
jgi:hypothetical protein